MIALLMRGTLLSFRPLEAQRINVFLSTLSFILYFDQAVQRHSATQGFLVLLMC